MDSYFEFVFSGWVLRKSLSKNPNIFMKDVWVSFKFLMQVDLNNQYYNLDA